MTCRHSPGDPSCSSNRPYEPPAPAPPATPDASNYSVEKAERVGTHLVLKVKYPNCRRCSYEGNKIMVFLNIVEFQTLKWKKIDPHFRDTARNSQVMTEAPSPAARFPGSEEGWKDALNYARSK